MQGKIVALAAAAVLLGGAKAPVVGEPAPDVELTLMDGAKVHLSDLRGQVVVLNFWATWCVPCRRELPTLDDYYKQKRARGMRAFAVTTEGSLPLYKLKPLFAAMTVTPVRRVKGPYDYLGGVPTNFVIDRAGRLRYAKAAAFDRADLDAVVTPLLAEPAPAQ